VVAMVRTKEAAEDMKGLGATAIVANAFDYKVGALLEHDRL